MPKESIVGVQGIRHSQTDVTKEMPLTYARISNRSLLDFDIDYNSAIYGPFAKDQVLRLVGESVGDADVESLEILLPPEFSKFMAERFEKEYFANHRYVVRLDHYPCRRDGERNEFWADIKAFMEPNEAEWMEPASLDFSYVLPDQVFKDVSKTKGRVGGEYREQIEQWKRTAGRDSAVIRRAVDLSFPHDYTNARTYRWGPEEKWLLDSVGNF